MEIHLGGLCVEETRQISTLTSGTNWDTIARSQFAAAMSPHHCPLQHPLFDQITIAPPRLCIKYNIRTYQDTVKTRFSIKILNVNVGAKRQLHMTTTKHTGLTNTHSTGWASNL